MSRKQFHFVPLLALLTMMFSRATSAETWGLLVGVGKYQNPQISALKYPATDAEGVRDALTNPQLGGIPAGNVLVLTDEKATGAAIRDAVSSFLGKRVKPGDSVILFLAGHGVAKGVGVEAKSYLLPYDTKGLSTAALDSSAIDLKMFSTELGKLPASQFILFVDACREDPTPGRGIKGNLLTDILSRSVTVLPDDPARSVTSVAFFACKVGQRAYEDPTYQHGVFTYWILNAIKEATVAVPPKGEIEMGRLSSFVNQKVKEWVKKAAASQSFELEQTPELVGSGVLAPVVLVNVKRSLPTTPFAPSAPEILVSTVPENAVVTLNGNKVSVGPVAQSAAKEGLNTVRVEAPGYQPVEKTVQGFGGYEQRVLVTLNSSGASASGSPAQKLFDRAVDAEQKQQWEVAQAGYDATIDADPKFLPAYERLATIQSRRGQYPEATKTLITLNSKTTPTARSLALLSHTYSAVALRQGNRQEEEPKKKSSGGILGNIKNPFGKKEKKEEKKEEPTAVEEVGDYAPTDKPAQAAGFALKAAREAVGVDKNSGFAQSALGFALMAGDRMGSNKEEALQAFGKAVFLEEKDPLAHYGLGYALRFFSLYEKDDAIRKGMIDRAIASLKTATELRSDYYEAHRELGYCYHIQGENDRATNSYNMANANRGTAQDKDEVAGINIALSTILQQKALTSDAATKSLLQATSNGYINDAKDLSPNLETALRVLRSVGMGRKLTDHLDGSMRRILDKIPAIPGVPRIRL